MTDFRERYKRAGFGRDDQDVNRELRSQRRDEARRDLRTEQYSRHRGLDLLDELHDDSIEPPPGGAEEEEKKPVVAGAPGAAVTGACGSVAKREPETSVQEVRGREESGRGLLCFAANFTGRCAAAVFCFGLDGWG